MNHRIPDTTFSDPDTPEDVGNTPVTDPCKLLWAAGEPVRWKVLRELAGGTILTVQELAAKVGRRPNQMGKHLAMLRSVGALELVTSLGADGRKAHHAVPDRFRRLTASGQAELDFGVCVLRFAAGKL
jgi:hypothetical protein